MARRIPLRTGRVAGVLAALSVITACSLSDDEQTAADTIESALVTKQSPKSVEESAECIAEKWVGEVGTGALERDGVIDDRSRAREAVVQEIAAGRQPVSEAVAEGYAAAWYACADFDAVSLDQEESFPDASEGDLDEYADCLKAIDDDLWRDALTDRLTGARSSSANTGLRRELTECRDALDAQAG